MKRKQLTKRKIKTYDKRKKEYYLRNKEKILNKIKDKYKEKILNNLEDNKKEIKKEIKEKIENKKLAEIKSRISLNEFRNQERKKLFTYFFDENF